MTNQSSLSEFLLLQFAEVRELQILHFLLFLVLYLAIVTGNLLIISAVAFDHRLHTPMYLFLMNLAIQDLGAVSVIMPKSMANSLFNTRHISYLECVAQVLLVILFLSSDIYLLTVMAYDRYVAICNPLQYEMMMNKQVCIKMIAGVWIVSLLHGSLHAAGTFATPFCSNVVNQFFCEVPPMLKLTCSDLNLPEIGAIVFGIVLALGCFVFVIITYVPIFISVSRIPSVQGRQKAFSTCLPHLIIFSTFIVTGSIAYLKPTPDAPSNLDLTFTVLYSIVPPMMNPLIYSIRNKEIKMSISKFLGFSKRAFFGFFFYGPFTLTYILS
ncbi:olfactory receptor 14A16-like [Tiliqua scincoides]|uniref:olfactory receptor 14A16-like n=1 Tax=Tiliqua scincoides TaxID=71010 RepID=UPI003461992E